MSKAGRNRAVLRAALTLAVLALLAALSAGAGCGRKAPPEPLEIRQMARIKDLSYSLSAGTLRLTWTVPEESAVKTAPVSGFVIYRSQQSKAEKECSDCPRHFVEVGDIPVPAAGSGASKLVFSDQINPGYRYVYKVVAYSEGGQRGKDSNLVDFEY